MRITNTENQKLKNQAQATKLTNIKLLLDSRFSLKHEENQVEKISFKYD